MTWNLLFCILSLQLYVLKHNDSCKFNYFYDQIFTSESSQLSLFFNLFDKIKHIRIRNDQK